MRRRWDGGAVVDAAVRQLLMREIDPPHVPFQVGEEPGKALFEAPNVGTGGLAAAVGAFPAVCLPVGRAEHDAMCRIVAACEVMQSSSQ